MIDAPSESLFKRIRAEGLEYFAAAVREKIAENYYLEFKTTAEADYTNKRRLAEPDQKNLARCISAFGNSEGGVIVWGIKTGGPGNDYAERQVPIRGARNFLSLLEGLTSTLTSPPHPEVTHLCIDEREGESSGYIITYIPKSSYRPFQVLHDKEFRYYIRAGSSCSPAPDVFVRSLFGRTPQPNTFLYWGLVPTEIIDETIRVKVNVMIVNKGETTAKNVNGYVHVGGRGVGIIVNQPETNNFLFYKNDISGMKVSFTAKPHFILGVEQEIMPLTLQIDIRKPTTGIQIYTLVNADNQLTYRGAIDITAEKLEQMYNQRLSDSAYDIGKVLLSEATS